MDDIAIKETTIQNVTLSIDRIKAESLILL